MAGDVLEVRCTARFLFSFTIWLYFYSRKETDICQSQCFSLVRQLLQTVANLHQMNSPEHRYRSVSAAY